MIKKATYLLVFVAIFVALSKAIFPTGPRVANDFPIVSQDTLKESFRLPQIWSSRSSEGLGEYSAITLWSWPLDFLGGVSARLGLNFNLIEIFVLLIPTFTFGIISIRKVFDRYKIGDPGRLVGTFLYLANTYFLLLIDGGQISIALTYAVFPLIFLLFIDSIGSSFKKRLVSAVGIATLGFLDIRFVYVLGVLIFIHFLFSFVVQRKRLWLTKEYLKSGIVAIVTFTTLHFYWIFPVITVKANLIPAAYDTSIKNFTNLYHSFLLLQPHWYLNVFGKITYFKFEFIFIPILVLLAPVLKIKNKVVAFWILVAVVSLFLTKGSSPPIGDIYTWLYSYVPGFSLFRDSTKFFFLVALSYSVLLGITTNEISKRIKVFPLIVVLYLIFLIRPIYTGKMTGVFSAPSSQKEYSMLSQTLSLDREFGRVLWLPSRSPLGYSDSNHGLVEGLRVVLRRPFAIGTVGTYEVFNFLREAPFIGQIMDIASIKYLIYPYPDTRRENLSKDNIEYYHSFLDQISKLPWVKSVEDFGNSNSPLPLITVKKNEDHIFLAPNLWGVLGSDKVYPDLVNINKFDLSKNALVFLEEKPGITQQLINTYGKIISFNKSEIDLRGSLIDPMDFIFPASSLGASPDSSGWWKRNGSDLISWRSFLQEKYKIDNLDFDYTGGWAVAEGNLRLRIESGKFKKGNVLFARVMKSSKGGTLSFYQNNNLIGLINTKVDRSEKTAIKLTGGKDFQDKYFTYDSSDFEWFEVGNLKEDGSLTIVSHGEINVTNSLASVSEQDWNRIGKQASKLEGEGRILVWNKLGEQKSSLFATNSNVSLIYSQISPTQYNVKIKGLKNPATLVFSENYDPLWRVEGSETLPLYSLVNGFVVSHDGDYKIEFTPQKYVNTGFKLSIIGVIILIFIFLFI